MTRGSGEEESHLTIGSYAHDGRNIKGPPRREPEEQMRASRGPEGYYMRGTQI